MRENEYRCNLFVMHDRLQIVGLAERVDFVRRFPGKVLDTIS